MAPPLRKAAATVATRADGSVRIACVADSHSSPHPATVDRLRALAPDVILHAGDIGELAVLDDLRAIAPVIAVRGNIDGRANDLPDVITVEIADAARPLLRLLLVHIAVAGPKLRADVARIARAEHASLVVCGHSHVPFIGEDRGLTMFNPGSIGPRRFALPIVFGMLELGPRPRGVRLAHVSCETGERWLPPA